MELCLNLDLLGRVEFGVVAVEVTVVTESLVTVSAMIFDSTLAVAINCFLLSARATLARATAALALALIFGTAAAAGLCTAVDEIGVSLSLAGVRGKVVAAAVVLRIDLSVAEVVTAIADFFLIATFAVSALGALVMRPATVSRPRRYEAIPRLLKTASPWT